MGCDSGYMHGYTDERQRKALDTVTRLLCETLTVVEHYAIMIALRESVEGLTDWWDEHKEADRKRQETERKKQQAQENKALRKQQREALLARLTPEERALLGVR